MAQAPPFKGIRSRQSAPWNIFGVRIKAHHRTRICFTTLAHQVPSIRRKVFQPALPTNPHVLLPVVDSPTAFFLTS
ncbi:MAG: hypothetical protein DWI24_00615 [Planctomycetota bacterium]|nr:MAG: hypothetical protein DWI24_00615 [Planctomycetota bacterium]